MDADPSRPTPAIRLADGIDYVKMPWWKVLLIQFLNIAGLGPIFGAIAGALWALWRLYGLFSEQYLAGLYMTTFRVCFPSDTMD